MEAFDLVIFVRQDFLLGFIKMIAKDMDFDGHPAAYFAKGLNQFLIVFGFVITQDAPDNCDKSVLRGSFLLRPREFLKELLAL